MKKMILVSSILLSMLLSPNTVNAHRHSGYSDDSGVEFQNSKWMDAIRDDIKLSDLSIPGTHNTMSNGPGGDTARNQVKSLSEQLNSGIRFLDIRARVTSGKLAMHHGPIFLNSMFGDVMNGSVDFLKKNPSEVIFMRIKQEHSTSSDQEFIKILNSYLDSPTNAPYIYQGSNRTNPSMQEMRGKIVIIRNFAGSSMGIHYNSEFDIQDNHNLSTNWDLHDYKWEPVKRQLYKANNNSHNENKYINYLSGSGGSFPYFVASGHSSRGTSAPRLATGLTHPGWKDSYPDFPRVDWFMGIATIAFEGTNVLTTDLIRNNNVKNNTFFSVGVILADFPGSGLINNVIGLNTRHSKEDRIPDGIYSIHSTSANYKAIQFISKGRDAVIWESNDDNNQKFEFKYDYNKQAYQIFNKDGNNIIMAWNNVGNSDKVFGHPNEYKEEHYWILERSGTNMYIFKNKKDSNKVLDVHNLGQTNGTRVKVNERHPYEHGSAQRFALNVNN